jgi:hypothetical protein
MLLGGAGTVNCQPRRDGVQDICLCMYPTTVRYSWITRLVVGGLDLFVLLPGGPVVRLTFGDARVMVLGDAFGTRTLLLVATYQSLLLEMPA